MTHVELERVLVTDKPMLAAAVSGRAGSCAVTQIIRWNVAAHTVATAQ